MVSINQTEVKNENALTEEVVKEDHTPSLSIIPLNPDGVTVVYTFACDLETKHECVVFEFEEESDDCGEPIKRVTEVPQQFYRELKKQRESKESSPVKSVCTRHYDEFKASGIPDEAIATTLKSLSRAEVCKALGWSQTNEQPEGWTMLTIDPTDEGAEQQITRSKIDFLPTWLIESAKKKAREENKEYKEPKTYRQKSGEQTKPLFPKVPLVGNCKSWKEYLANRANPVWIVEGEKKALLLTSLGCPCVALAGVWNWQFKAKSKELHPWLKLVAAGGRQIYLAFDADLYTNTNVQMALLGLSELLEGEGATVSGMFWDAAKGKGIDDYLVNFPESNRKDEVGELIKASRPIKDEVKAIAPVQVVQGKPPKKPSFKGSRAANHLAEKYRAKLAWNTEINMFMQYGYKHDGVWSVVAPEAVVDVISSEMDNGSLELDGCPGHSHNEAMSVFNLLKGKLIRGEWRERDNSLPFENGVLDIKTRQLLPHSPLNYFTWQIPRSHDPQAKDFPKINEWLDWASDGDEQFKLLLLCWLNAVLVGRSGLHRFFNAHGTGRNGKGIHQQLAIELVGKNNVCTSDLKTWNNNNFETSNAYGKRLIVFPDEDKCQTGIGMFKKVTGGDLLRYEKKGKDATGFVFKGMVMLASNYPVFQGENSTAMDRRTILAKFNRTITIEEQRDMMPDFLPELSALTNYLLAMDEDLVVRTLKGLNQSKRMKEDSRAFQVRSNPMLAWVKDYLEYEEDGEESVGSKKEGECTLYNSYYEYCKNAGNSPKSLQNFSADLVDTLTNNLGWKGVKKRSSSRGRTAKFRGQRGSFIDNVKIIPSGDLA